MNADLDPVNDEDECECDWPGGCGGLGVISCEGCGGDFCVCLCGGGSECFGCEDCNARGDYDDDDDDCDPMQMGDAGWLVPRGGSR